MKMKKANEDAYRNIWETASFILRISSACWCSRLALRATMSSSSRSCAFWKLQPAINIKLHRASLAELGSAELLWENFRHCWGGCRQIEFTGSSGGGNSRTSSGGFGRGASGILETIMLDFSASLAARTSASFCSRSFL